VPRQLPHRTRDSLADVPVPAVPRSRRPVRTRPISEIPALVPHPRNAATAPRNPAVRAGVTKT
jgi:hypothetical protein